MGKFTPGPWIARKAENGISFHVVSGNDLRLVIAGTQPYPVAPHQANAHLIAAAPDFFTSLGALLAAKWANFTEDETDMQPELLAARAALAKAQGNIA